MLGFEFDFPVKELQVSMLNEGVFTGGSSNPKLIRILPPLNITATHVDEAVSIIEKSLAETC